MKYKLNEQPKPSYKTVPKGCLRDKESHDLSLFKTWMLSLNAIFAAICMGWYHHVLFPKHFRSAVHVQAVLTFCIFCLGVVKYQSISIIFDIFQGYVPVTCHWTSASKTTMKILLNASLYLTQSYNSTTFKTANKTQKTCTCSMGFNICWRIKPKNMPNMRNVGVTFGPSYRCLMAVVISQTKLTWPPHTAAKAEEIGECLMTAVPVEKWACCSALGWRDMNVRALCILANMFQGFLTGIVTIVRLS